MDALDLPNSHDCFVCGIDNPHGLQLRFQQVGDRVSSETTLARHHAGFADRAHGGIVASLLDEAMGWAAILISHRFTYTVDLQVRYKRPAPIGVPLRLEAWIERHTRRLSFAAGSLSRLDGEDDGDGVERSATLLAEANGKFMMAGEAESRQIAEQLIYRDDSWRLPTDEA